MALSISEIKKLHSDKKILFVYDGNISSKIIRNLLDDLKLSGCKIFFTKLQSSKKNKNQKILFSIIDKLIANNFSNRSIIGNEWEHVCPSLLQSILNGLCTRVTNMDITMSDILKKVFLDESKRAGILRETSFCNINFFISRLSFLQ